MNLLFNPAQLSRPQQQSLIEVLGVMESENDQEIEVRVIEFPLKFAVKLDDGVEMMLGWDVEKKSYAGLTKPEPEPEHGTLEVDLPGPESESQKGIVDFKMPESKPESELDLSPVIERAEALARAFVNLTKPLNTDQRIELWAKFCNILFKELSK